MTSEQVLNDLGVAIPWTLAESSYNQRFESLGKDLPGGTSDLDTPRALKTFWLRSWVRAIILLMAVVVALMLSQLMSMMSVSMTSTRAFSVNSSRASQRYYMMS